MTQLTVYQRMENPLAAVKEIGSAIAKSQMFGCESESQGQVFALHCLATGRDPLSIVESYHLMHGKLTLKSEDMLARVVDAGGKYEIVEHSPEAAEIRITYQGRTMHERFSWEDAKLEPFVYQGKPKDIMPHLLAGQFDKLTISTNYATPRRRMQHLWARVVSDAVRVIAPNVLRGKYTPEEMHQAAIDDGKIPPTSQLVQPTEESEAFDAAFEVVEEVAEESLPWENPVERKDDPILGGMIKRITDLFVILKVPPDAQLTAMKKRGASDMGRITIESASDLLTALELKLAKVESEAIEPTKEDQSFAIPVDENQVTEIRSLLAQVVQLEGMGNLAGQVKDHLDKFGMKLADLNRREAQLFIEALSKRNLALFFELSLQGYKVARTKEEPANP